MNSTRNAKEQEYSSPVVLANSSLSTKQVLGPLLKYPSITLPSFAKPCEGFLVSLLLNLVKFLSLSPALPNLAKVFLSPFFLTLSSFSPCSLSLSPDCDLGTAESDLCGSEDSFCFLAGLALLTLLALLK